MNVIYVDDETLAIQNLKLVINELDCIDSFVCFSSAASAIEFACNNSFDVALLDIEMPSFSGIELAKKLIDIHPQIEILFITGYDSYALDAYKIGSISYILKPYSQDDIKQAFTLLKKIFKEDSNEKKVFFKTFGNFDLLVNDKAVYFKNAKSKELLALLIDRKGSSLTNKELFLYLWENKEYNNNNSTYVRKALRDLVSQLNELGLSDIITEERTAKSIVASKIQCDYYELLKNNKAFASEFNGLYMSQYSWAKETIPLIKSKLFEIKK